MPSVPSSRTLHRDHASGCRACAATARPPWTWPGSPHGRFDGYLGARDLKPWDIAAGELLVREAGGYATDVGDGSPLVTGNIVAGNPHLHAKLRTIVAEGMQPAA